MGHRAQGIQLAACSEQQGDAGTGKHGDMARYNKGSEV